ncbi:hypothetical protein PV04_00562 [Phialophora macrospora]|uniref:GH16 domain-containing protein n=1 Tax=Phialophora macrospora TaxID=1851006 RepID=A0A0D2FV59_9EURO|nr:hypothetical protein PV04_00562 [Phialophora macrospora]
MPSPSLFLGSSTTLVSALLLLSSAASAAFDTYYALETDYSGRDFFDGFQFYADADPTHGFVTYVDEITAKADGLVTTRFGSAQIKVDSTNTYNGSAPYSNINGVGRPSVRIESIESWTHGLFIADIKHMPTTADTSGCGVWPAFWTLGSGTWPYNGEIDIIEGANNQATDLSSAHVAGSCVISQRSTEMTGTSNGNNCQYNVNTGANAQGCGAFSKSSVSYGAGFNSNNGGVYAMEWKSDAIKIWFFPRGSIPSDISSGNPDPAGWGIPDSIFNGPGCDIDANFADNRFIFDTTFCGDFGEATWTGGGCAAIESQSQCSVFVGDHPEQFTEAYWDVNYVRVYQPQPVIQPTSSSTTTTSTTTSASSSTTTTGETTTTEMTPSQTTPSQTTTSETTASETTASETTTSETTTSETTTSPYSYSNTLGPQLGSTSAPATPTTTTTWYATSDSPSPSTTSPYVHPTATSSVASSETTWADWLSSTSVAPDSPAFTSSGSWDGTTSGFDWADWEASKTSSSTSSKPVKAATTSTSSYFDWADWEASKPSTSSYFDWADWEASKSSTSEPADPETTSAFAWGDWKSDSSVAPVSTATWSSPEGKPVSPVAAASSASGAWVSPSVTVAITVTVAPVASSAWVEAASATPVAPSSIPSNGPSSTGPWVAAYTGAAGRTGTNALALLAAGAVAVGVLAL